MDRAYTNVLTALYALNDATHGADAETFAAIDSLLIAVVDRREALDNLAVAHERGNGCAADAQSEAVQSAHRAVAAALAGVVRCLG